MIRSAFCTLAVTALSVTATAQASQDAPTLRAPQQFTGPVQHYTLDYATKTLRKQDGADAQQLGIQSTTVNAYDNTCTSGFFTALGPGEEYLDWGAKSAGLSTVVTEFTFGYATGEVDVALGGPGASLDIAFFYGTTGFGTTGTEVARYTFTALPGASPGGISAFAITVDLVGGFEFCLADGDIGYSYCSTDPAGTGPLIGDIAACPNGQDDAFDIYACGADAASYVGTFFFGGAPTATWFMSIEEDDGSAVATTAVNIGAGINPLDLSDGGVAPVLNTVWPLTDTDGFGHGLSTAVWFSDSLAPGTVTLTNGLGTFEVIVDPTSSFGLSQTVPFVASVADHSILVPKDTTLLGLSFTVQAVHIGGGVPYSLSNGLDVTVGF